MASQIPAVALCAAVVAWAAASVIWANSQTRPSPPATGSDLHQTDPTLTVPPDSVVRWAVQQLASYHSVEASVAMSARLFGHVLDGSGKYFELRTPKAVAHRLDLLGRLKGQSIGLSQVCDGQSLWRLETLPDSHLATRIDLQRLQDHMANLKMSGCLGSWGKTACWESLADLVIGLQAEYEFQHAVPFRLSGGTSTWQLIGTCRGQRAADVKNIPKQRLAGIVTVEAGQGSAPAVTAVQHAQVPDQVIVYLDRQTAIPVRIQYAWNRSGTAGQGGAADNDRQLVIQFTAVRINTPPSIPQSAFQPPQADFVDRTDEYLEQVSLR